MHNNNSMLQAVLMINNALQGLRELRAKSFCLLLQKYESERAPELTGSSPDVVYLLKYASLVLG